MSHIEIFRSSRYIDYDYDKECIFGFDADEEDNNMIFGLAYNSNKNLMNKLKPLRLPVELIGDSWWRKKKRNKYRKYHPRTPSPISPQSTICINNNNNNNNNNKVNIKDKFDATATDKRIKLAQSDPSLDYKDTIVRTDKCNGQLYETHGTQYISNTHQWKFILHDKSHMIIGLIDADIIGKQKMNIFVNTETSNVIKTLFSSIPKEGCVIQITYDKKSCALLCKNITNESIDCGKEIVCVNKINVQKRYKLTILLNKPSTITMF